MSNRLSYDIGSKATIGDRPCIITAQTDFDQVLVRFQDDGKIEAVNIVNLKPTVNVQKSKEIVLDAYHENDLDVAQERFSAIEPIYL